MAKQKTVKCLNCYQIVEVPLTYFGCGYVGVCPLCDGIAYNRGIKKAQLHGNIIDTTKEIDVPEIYPKL